jgi:aryl-alcohol dehydrogenase-like predicted oxidoreductase
MLVREKVEGEFRRLYDAFGLGTTIWSPLASGILTGKYARGIPRGSRVTLPEYGWLKERFESEEGRAQIAKARELEGVARELGTSLTRLAIAWCLRSPIVSTVILGASHVGQLEENLGALDVLPKLTPEVLETIEGVLQNAPEPPRRF